MADVTARNARLDQLTQDAQAWATQQTKALNDQVSTLKAILQGRSGSQALAQSAVAATSTLVVNEINDFLVG